jgi:hypothetical protein
MWGSSAMGGLELAKMADFYADLWSSDTFAPACLHGVWWSCTEPRPLMETQTPAGPWERSGGAAAGEAGNGGDLLN